MTYVKNLEAYLYEASLRLREVIDKIIWMVRSFDGNIDHLKKKGIPVEMVVNDEICPSNLNAVKLQWILKVLNVEENIVDEYKQIVMCLSKCMSYGSCEYLNRIIIQKTKKYYNMEEEEKDDTNNRSFYC